MPSLVSISYPLHTINAILSNHDDRTRFVLDGDRNREGGECGGISNNITLITSGRIPTSIGLSNYTWH
jgi:hypothetical protein